MTGSPDAPTPAVSWREELRAERHGEEEAHAARVARAAAAGITPAAFARRATADAYQLHAAARATAAKHDHPPAVRFALYPCAALRDDWNQDRADACLRRARSLGLLRSDRREHDAAGGPTFTVDSLQGGRCPTCGHPLTAVMPRRHDPADDQPDLFSQPADDDDQEQGADGPCVRCWDNPDAATDARALLERIGAEWTAYRTRPSQKANGRYDEGGHHAYMRCAFNGFGVRDDDGRHPFQTPADWPRCYSHRDRDWHERRALARLIADGLVAMVDDPHRRENCLRATFGVTAAGARLLRLDLDSLPAPVCGPFRTHKARGRRGTPVPAPAPGQPVCACGHAVADHSPTQSVCLDFIERTDGRVVRCECPAPVDPDYPAPTRAERARYLTEELRAERAAATPADAAPAADALTLF